jgi:hypothetical protein
MEPLYGYFSRFLHEGGLFQRYKLGTLTKKSQLSAHKLAKFSSESNYVVSCDDAPPSFIFPFVLDDVTILASQ